MESTKKEMQAYHTPQVTDYGNIKQITMVISDNGASDGGRDAHRKRTGL